jgi:hypothetical protein
MRTIRRLTPRPSRHQAALVWLDKTLLLHRGKSTITGSGLHRWTRQITRTQEERRQIMRLQGSRRDGEASRRHQAEDRRATTTEDLDHRSNETDTAPKTSAPHLPGSSEPHPEDEVLPRCPVSADRTELGSKTEEIRQLVLGGIKTVVRWRCAQAV